MKGIKTFLIGLCVGLTVLGMAVGASALLITPSTGIAGVSRWVSNETASFGISYWPSKFYKEGTSPKEFFNKDVTELMELYKADVKINAPPSESGPLSSSYSTVYSNSPNDPQEATITYDGGPYVNPTLSYLVVKDGNANPAQYLFDLSSLDWKGTDTLELRGFWPNQGAISHLALYGTAAVPEPTSLLLLGLGLVGLAGARRMLRK